MAWNSLSGISLAPRIPSLASNPTGCRKAMDFEIV